jgi:alcohol dehydrogenase (cytochrome c)
LKRSRLSFAVLTALLAGSTATTAFAQSDAPFVPVTNEMLENPPDEDWLLWHRTQNHWGYSPLDQINKENVADLQLVWARGMEPGIQEGTPIVHDGVMYLPNPGGVIQALDAATGDLVWEYRRVMPDDLAEYASINETTRNIGIYEDKIIYVSADSYLIALDARTGAVAWETQIADYKQGNMQSSGPMIANGKAFTGRSCQPRGGPETCFITAHDLATGEELWRTFTIPRPGDPGYDTWSNIPYESRWHVGSWITPSYDPELNTVYVGTSVTSPYAKYTMGAEDQDAEFLYQTSTLALDADTGAIKWYQQHIRDQWDLDHPFERVLVDTAIAPKADEVPWINPNVVPGKEYKVLTGIPGKTGIFYSIDRETGEFLWARPTVEQNTVVDIDPATGRATMNPDLFYTASEQEHMICRGKDWPFGTYSPLTNAMYYPLLNMCGFHATIGDEPDVEEMGQMSIRSAIAPGYEDFGTVKAISVETGALLWDYQQRAGVLSVMSTGGGLLFGGDYEGKFRAFDQETGDILWESKLGTPTGGYPISYAVDGRQYVATTVGPFLIVGGRLATTPEIKPSMTANYLFVFALPEE